MQDLCSVRRHGEVLSRRQDYHDRQSCPPKLTGQQTGARRSSRLIRFQPGKEDDIDIRRKLGARTINQTLIAALDTIKAHSDVQFIWQTGKIYIQQIKDAITTATGEAVRNPRIPAIPNLYVTDFIKDMASAYAAADLVISRAGAGSISEFCLLNKPVILVPSPNVAEDHQTKNALALVDKKAAIYVKDVDAMKHLVSTALATVADDDKLKTLSENIATLLCRTRQRSLLKKY